MAAPTAANKGLAGTLTAKKGPLPVWAWLALGAVAVYYLYRRYSGGSSANPAAVTQAAPPSQPASTDAAGLTGSAGTSGDTSGLAAAGVDPTALLNSLGAQNQSLTQALLQAEEDVSATAAGQLAAFQSGSLGASTGTPVATVTSTASQPGGSNAPTFHYSPVPVQTKNFAQAAVAESNTAKAAGKTSAFGGVTGVHKNAKTGVVTTTYANGRVVEQAPGKTAYVAKRGKKG